ncbi:hypothetical protein HDV01_004605 [Terramyces sp. JEL0728]|nr:hypothetical protein HDV01_004605 [Terramyces sp. JEL0728]
MEYQFEIRQEPTKGREAGLTKPYFKSNLYPILVLQLVFPKDLTKEELESFNVVCNIVLLGEDDSFEHVLYGSKAALRRLRENLFGNTTSEAKLFIDAEDGKPKIFFIFSNLYIKVPGRYRFLCQLVDFTQEIAQVKELKTSEFEVLKLKEFTLDHQPSVLLRSFELQGFAHRKTYR